MTAPASWKEWQSSMNSKETGHATSRLNIPVWDMVVNKPGSIVAFIQNETMRPVAIVCYADGSIDDQLLSRLKWKGVLV